MSLRSPSTICSRALSWFLLKETVGKGARSVELTVGPQLPSASGEGPASAGPNSRPFASGPYDFRSLWCCSLLLFRPSDRDPLARRRVHRTVVGSRGSNERIGVRTRWSEWGGLALIHIPATPTDSSALAVAPLTFSLVIFPADPSNDVSGGTGIFSGVLSVCVRARA